MASFNELARKKVAGVPIIYLAGGFVVILAVVAYKMKATVTPDVASPDSAGTDMGEVTDPYDSLNGSGTVTVVQQPSTNTDETLVSTNQTWVNDGTKWLSQNKQVPGSDAMAALTKYIEGSDRTYDEKQWVDAYIAVAGPPPDGVTSGGAIGNKPAQKQFSNFPGKHTVKGYSDNTFGDIATLYYGHNEQATYDLVQAANTNIGPSGPFAEGTVINVPAYHPPVYYTVTANSMTSAQVASKNGISTLQLEALNNTSKTSWPKNAKVRVK